MNPVLARETRERFRGRRTAVLFTTWVLVVGLVTYAAYLLAGEVARSGFGMGRMISTGYMGRFLFQSMTLLLVTAVVMVVPGITALAIVGERERQTLPLLQLTQLGPMQLVLGKLSASIGYFVLLLVAVLPLAALPLVFGGASLGDVLGALGMLITTAVMLAALSMWISARARSSRGAVAGAYAVSFAITFLTLVLMVGELFLFRPTTDVWFGEGGREVVSVLANPYFAMVSAVDAPLELRQDFAGAGPFSPFEVLLYRRQAVRTAMEGFVEGVPPGALRIEQGRQFVRMVRAPLWLYSVVIYLALIALGVWRASVHVRAPARARGWRANRAAT